MYIYLATSPMIGNVVVCTYFYFICICIVYFAIFIKDECVICVLLKRTYEILYLSFVVGKWFYLKNLTKNHGI